MGSKDGTGSKEAKGLRYVISRSSVANIVSGVVVIVSLIYLIWTKNTEGVLFLAGAGVGYLFKTVSKGPGE